MVEPIFVATFNIQHGRTPGGEVDVELLARCCAGLAVDVLALQEVDRNLRRSHDADTAAVVAEACGMQHVYGAAIAIRGGEYGNALLVRGDIDDVEVVPIPDEEPRAAILARVRVDGSSVSVAATHLGLRGAGAVQLPALLDRLAARSGPRLLMGDLNVEPDVVEPLAAAAGFARVATGPTWPAARPRRTIDHVLVDGLDVADGGAAVTHLPVSDHRAVVVGLRCR